MEKPAYWRIVHGRLAYIVARTPRVNGAKPGRVSTCEAVEVGRGVERFDVDALGPSAHVSVSGSAPFRSLAAEGPPVVAVGVGGVAHTAEITGHPAADPNARGACRPWIASGDIDEWGPMALNPTKEQITRLLEDSAAKDGQVVMLNLLKFRERADDGQGGSGEEAYSRYGAQAVQKVTERGGRVLWMGKPDSVVIGDEAAGDWDAVILVMYPNRAAFIDMTSDPEYQKAHVHREGGLERMTLVAMTPGTGFVVDAD